MNVLLVTDVPPCTDYSGALLTKELCQYFPDNSVFAYVIKNKELGNIAVDKELKLMGDVEVEKPRETTINMKHGGNPIYNFYYETYKELVLVKKIGKGIMDVITQKGIDRIWIILQGQTMIHVAKYIIDNTKIPVITQVWDHPKWWLEENKVNWLSTQRILRNYEYVIGHSQACGVASDNMGNEYHDKYSLKCRVIIPTLKIAAKPITENILASKHDIKIGMCGQLYAKDEWDSLVAALEGVNWEINGKTVKIIYVGYSLNENINPNIINHGYKSQSDVLDIMGECDILYCPYIINEAKKHISIYSFPSKVVSYMAASRPILYHGPMYSSPAKLITNSNLGIACDSLEAKDIIGAITSILASESDYAQLQKNVADVYAREFTTKELQAKWRELFEL